MAPEPVSPELVLIDPELAGRERAKLEERAQLRAILDLSDLRRIVETAHAPPEEIVAPPETTFGRGSRRRDFQSFSRRRILPAALLCSLLANGIFAADFVARTDKEVAGARAQVAVRMATLARSASSTSTTNSIVDGLPNVPTAIGSRGMTPRSKNSGEAGTAKASVERKLASLIVAAPAQKLPAPFVDPSTGLVKNNLQVICQRRPKRSFLCLVRMAGGTPTEGLYVRYRQTRSAGGVFTWYGYNRRPQE